MGLKLGREAVPDWKKILNFPRLLERQESTKAIFAAVAEHLQAKGELLRGGTIIMSEACFQHDAMQIAASLSTKYNEQRRDPEVSSSKRGNQWYFGMKPQVGVDPESRAEDDSVLWAVKANRVARSRGAYLFDTTAVAHLWCQSGAQCGIRVTLNFNFAVQ